MEVPVPSHGLAARRQVLRTLIDSRSAILLPGATDALSARTIEAIGFKAAYLSGAGLTNSQYGLPDLAFINCSDVVEATYRISDVCSLPLIVDIDTGFGNAVNAYQTLRRIEAAGAAGVQIEDQIFPKRCGHFSGKAVVPIAEMEAKIKACVDARRDSNTVVVARTDAIAVHGFSVAMERAHAMSEAGADVIFVEAPTTLSQVTQIGQLSNPTLLNIVVGGQTPMLSLDELQKLGISLVLYANAGLQAAMKATHEVLSILHAEGDLKSGEDRLVSFVERQELVDKQRFDDLSTLYEIRDESIN
ncbi:MAG: oxaloacetate decarboxylase [Pseudomonadota bacterium]